MRRAAAARSAPLRDVQFGAAPTMQSLVSPASYLNPGLARMLPFSGGSPFAAGQQFAAMAPMLMATPGIGVPVSGQLGMMPGPTTGEVPTLTGLTPAAGAAPGLAMPVVPGATAPALTAAGAASPFPAGLPGL